MLSCAGWGMDGTGQTDREDCGECGVVPILTVLDFGPWIFRTWTRHLLCSLLPFFLSPPYPGVRCAHSSFLQNTPVREARTGRGRSRCALCACVFAPFFLCVVSLLYLFHVVVFVLWMF